MSQSNRILETRGVITAIKYPFSIFKKKNAIVFLRLYNGNIKNFEVTTEQLDKLPPSMGVGMYTEIQYSYDSKSDRSQILNFL